MPEPATINDKRTLDGPGEEMRVARDLRQARRGGTSEEDSSLDNLISLAGGVGGMGTDSRRKPDGSGRDNLGRPVRPESPVPASRGSQARGNGSKLGQPGQGGAGAEPSFAHGQPAGAGSDLDSRLMAGQLREEKNKALQQAQGGEGEGEKRKEEEKGEGGEEDKEGKGGLGDRINRLKEQANLKKRAQKKIEEKVTAPAKKGTNSLLRKAWWSTFSVMGFFPGLFHINLHALFLLPVFGDKLFCKLGEEWIPKEIKAAGGEAGKAAENKFGIVEWIILGILDLIALTIIGGALALLVMIVDFMEKGFIGKAGAIIGGLTHLSWGAVKTLFDLFKEL